MFWYVAPVCAGDSCGLGIHPGISSGCMGVFPGLARVHCYDPPAGDPENPPTTCLVGSPGRRGYPGWVGKTPEEARQIFRDFYGREPTESEVF